MAVAGSVKVLLRTSPAGIQQSLRWRDPGVLVVLDRVEKVGFAAGIGADEGEERRNVQLEVQEGLEAVDLDPGDH
ncbi:hypothetical protein K8Z49_41990 [Actinomadura madurae]|nr:hypothetical protein [Actinomadura madurae]